MRGWWRQINYKLDMQKKNGNLQTSVLAIIRPPSPFTPLLKTVDFVSQKGGTVGVTSINFYVLFINKIAGSACTDQWSRFVNRRSHAGEAIVETIEQNDVISRTA